MRGVLRVACVVRGAWRVRVTAGGGSASPGESGAAAYFAVFMPQLSSQDLRELESP